MEIISQIERDGQVVEIVRRGEIVARLLPATQAEPKAWERLRGTGELLASPEEGVLEEHDFKALS